MCPFHIVNLTVNERNGQASVKRVVEMTFFFFMFHFVISVTELIYSRDATRFGGAKENVLDQLTDDSARASQRDVGAAAFRKAHTFDRGFVFPGRTGARRKSIGPVLFSSRVANSRTG